MSIEKPNIPDVEISAISEELKLKLLKKSPFSLPDNPSARGLKPNEIKKYLYSFVINLDEETLDNNPTVIGIIDKIILDANNSFANLRTYVGELYNYIETLIPTDTNIDEKIAVETEARKAADAEIREEIDTKIAEEANARQGRDDALAAEIQLNNTNATKDINNLKSEVSTLKNAGYIKNTVDNLVNYYSKSETLSKEEINERFSNLATGGIELNRVNKLPTTGDSKYIYLVPITGSANNVHDEYIWVQNKWEKIGSTAVDLSNYPTKDELAQELTQYAQLAIVAEYAEGGELPDDSFPDAPEFYRLDEDNANGLPSGLYHKYADGYKRILREGDGANITVDSALNSTSKNPVQNKAVYSALSNKADKADLKAVATSGDYNDLINKPNVTIPDALKNPNALKVGTKTYDGSTAVEITKSDLSLGNVENKSSETIRGEITKANVTTALGYTPLETAPAYTGSNGVSVSNHNITNTGVRSVKEGTTNGTISVNTNGTTADVKVAGINTAAYKAEGDFAPALHNHSASEITSGTLNAARLPSITSDKISSLDASKLTGTIPESLLPSYVDDVIEGTYVSTTQFKNTGGNVITPDKGKIYVDTTSNKTYRWSGSAYVEISASLALGTTSSTAYRGDRGNTAYTHSQTTSGNPHGVTKTDVGLGNVPNVDATNASNISSGTLPDARLSSNIARKSDIPTVDSAFSNTSTNPVQNKVIAAKIAELEASAGGGGSNVIEVAVEWMEEDGEGAWIGMLTEEQASSINESTILKINLVWYGILYFRYMTYNIEADAPTFAATVGQNGFMAMVQGTMVMAIQLPELVNIDNQWRGENDFVGGLTKNGVEVATIDDVANAGGGGGGSVTVDSALSETSENPVQNKVVTAALGEKITAPVVQDELVKSGDIINDFYFDTSVTNVEDCLSGLTYEAMDEGEMATLLTWGVEGGEATSPGLISMKMGDGYALVDINFTFLYFSANFPMEMLEQMGITHTGWQVENYSFRAVVSNLYPLGNLKLIINVGSNDQNFIYTTATSDFYLMRSASGGYIWEKAPEKTVIVEANLMGTTVNFNSSSVKGELFSSSNSILRLRSSNEYIDCFPNISIKDSDEKIFVGIKSAGNIVVCRVKNDTDIQEDVKVYGVVTPLYRHNIKINASWIEGSTTNTAEIMFTLLNQRSTAYTDATSALTELAPSTNSNVNVGGYYSTFTTVSTPYPILYYQKNTLAKHYIYIVFNALLRSIELTSDVLSSATVTDFVYEV